MSKFEYTTVTFARFPQMSFVDETVLSNYRTMAQEKFDTLTRERDELKAEVDRLHIVANGWKHKVRVEDGKLIKRIEKLREALGKISDPRKLGHAEPDYQTRYYCLINIATETLNEDDRAQSGQKV